ncbi:MAG: hypothetical protein DRQ06_02525 [Candidatus Hydrothermota bacterium]|uniref:Polyprenyl synthetase family protein n=1 Tax=candidate division WOR-3 bacterium TaxID=2052148 RepID=A0A7C1BG68_UNCW3|nr:MAG: hypothetical protein DRQ06_02525 [Candidatus Hydrothermae bacterium]HDM90388.1 polyprenyl synthetase family protein [candidate division WOR-3 bacterium]
MKGRLKTYWTERKDLVDRALDALLPGESEFPQVLHRAMRYTLFAGGKRLRPILAITGYEIAGGKDVSEVLPFAAALELIHTFSLIHDDLPAMDDDDMRRGKPSSHKVFGEGLAILAGDALFSHAFSLIAEADAPADVKIAVIREISRATGPEGLTGGQVLDLISEGAEPTEGLVMDIHRRKTAALISCSLAVGGIVGGAGEDLLSALREIGTELGLIFQVVDDILDEIGEKDKMGKGVRKDLERGKCTYVRLKGVEAALSDARAMRDRVKELVREKIGEEKGWVLMDLADYIVERSE